MHGTIMNLLFKVKACLDWWLDGAGCTYLYSHQLPHLKAEQRKQESEIVQSKAMIDF